MRRPTADYNAAYYDEIEETARPSAQVIAPILFDRLRPRSVLDVGCGNGYFLDAFRDLGVPETVGVDGPFVDRDALRLRGHEYIPIDLQNERIKLGRKWDLVLCLEVAEHLAPPVGTGLVADLVEHGKAVAFSAAVPKQSGRGHVNERRQSYWAALFEGQGYHAHDAVRLNVWDDDRVDWWYAQNLLLYLPEENPDPVPLDLIHFKMNAHVMPARAYRPTAREAAGALLHLARERLPWRERSG